SSLDLHVQQNFINGWVNGLSVFDSNPGSLGGLATGATVIVSNNDLSGNSGFGLASGSGEVVNASSNWWGTNSEAGVNAKVTGNVDRTPFLDLGTDTNLATPGFQGSFATLHVTAAGAQVGTTGRIQEGVNLLTTGGTEIVHNGLYKESNTTIAKSMTLQGESQAGVTIAPAAEGDNPEPSFGGGFQHGVIVPAPNATVKNLTIDGQANPSLTVGKNNFRAGVITDFRTNVEYDALDVENTTVKNIFRRGIQVSTGGTGNVIKNNTLDNIGAAASALGIASFGGNALIAGNSISNSVGGIGANADFDTPGAPFFPVLTIKNNTLTNDGVGMNLASLGVGSFIGG